MKATIGTHYYQVEGHMNGVSWDLGEYGKPCKTIYEAQENGRTWFSWLSDREKHCASWWVRRYEVIDIDDDGNISARSVGSESSLGDFYA